ncbi:MAG: universal stress protein [Steroidobacteraceae bacterium]
MDRIADILVIVDPSIGAAEQPAIAKAHLLAKRLDAGVELLACDTEYSREARIAAKWPGAARASLPDSLPAMLDRWAMPLRGDGVQVETHAITGDSLHQSVLSWMRNSPADLVVKDTHHHSAVRRTFMTNTDWNLIRACPLPLLLTKPARWRAPPVFAAAVDPGHANDAPASLDHRILDVTVTLARRLDARVHAIHAYFPSTIALAGPGGMPPLVDISAESLAAEQEQQHARIKHLTDEYGIDAVNLHVEVGAAAQYIPRVAAEFDADLVVMGAIARSGLRHVFIGSTAERVLEALPCDILVIKPIDFAKNLPF